jgi:predicted MFS family arabinose efflux permease
MAWNIGAVVGALGGGLLLTLHLSAPFLFAAWLNIPTLFIAMLVASGGHRNIAKEPSPAAEAG